MKRKIMTKRNKVFISILNLGWIKTELVIELYKWLKDSSLSYSLEFSSEQPVEHNRNSIAKRFLNSDCDFLLMIDNDVVPEKNPLNLIALNYPVFILPTAIRQEGLVMWNVYDLDNNGYWCPIKKKNGLLKISAGGTGCILIKKEVLLEIKAPFERLYDKDGLAVLGQDLSFCQKVSEKGFDIYTNFEYSCKHYKTTNISETI